MRAPLAPTIVGALAITTLAAAGCGTGEASGLATAESVREGALLDGSLDEHAAGSDAEVLASPAPRDASVALEAEPSAATDLAASAAGPAEASAAPTSNAAPDARATDASPAPGTTGSSASALARPPRASGKPRLVTFQDLSLLGLDVDAIFDPMEDEEGLAALPATIRDLHGALVSIEGYMIPMEWNGTRVSSFMLVRDMAGCCFGQMPQPDEWIEVLMEEGELAEYYPYVPVLVTGTFELAGETDDMGYVTGAYRMRGEEVADEW